MISALCLVLETLLKNRGGISVTQRGRACAARTMVNVAGTADDPIEIDIENPEFRRALRKNYRDLTVEVNCTFATRLFPLNANLLAPLRCDSGLTRLVLTFPTRSPQG